MKVTEKPKAAASKSTLAIEWRPIASVIPYDKNARRIPQKAVEKVAESIKTFGWRQPIVVDKKGIIVVGHVRLQAAEKLKLTSVPVHVASDLTPVQIRLYRLADNRLHEETTWDMTVLALEMSELQGMSVDLLDTFFDQRELSKILPGENPDEPPPARFDKATQLLKKYKVERGQIWSMGDHRLMCGDSSEAADVALLMGKSKAKLMSTDPPYGVKLKLENTHAAANDAHNTKHVSRHFDPILGDDLEGPALHAFLVKCFTAAKAVLDPKAAWYLWHAHSTASIFAAAAVEATGLLIHRQIIWCKAQFVFGRGDYHWQHEGCMYGWVEGNRPPFYGEHNQGTTWIVPDGGAVVRKDQNHPTEKPVELFRIPIVNHLKKHEICFEPFSGSGSQFVAAEQQNVRCFGLELEPKYVAVILERMAEMGVKVEKINVPRKPVGRAEKLLPASEKPGAAVARKKRKAK